jgi:hypothetical protein
MVYHTVHVLDDILIVRTWTVWITKLLNSWINMWTEWTVAVSGKACTSITGVLAHPLVCIHKCWSGVDGTYCHKVLREPSVGTNTVLVSTRVSRLALVPQLQLWRLHWLMSVRYVNEFHWQVPQLFTVPVSRRHCCSCWNTLVSGCCQVPVPVPVPVPDCYRYQGLTACRSVRLVCISLSFGHNWPLLCTAVCSTHNVTSSTASCVLLFTATFKHQTPCVTTNVAWSFSKNNKSYFLFTLFVYILMMFILK